MIWLMNAVDSLRAQTSPLKKYSCGFVIGIAKDLLAK